MKLEVNDPKANNVKAVLLDGKRIEMAVALDTDEGWVDIKLPKIVKAESFQAGGSVNIEQEDNTELDWQLKRLYGNVEVLWHEDTPSTSD